jgi:hypothetical protein
MHSCGHLDLLIVCKPSLKSSRQPRIHRILLDAQPPHFVRWPHPVKLYIHPVLGAVRKGRYLG